MPLWLIALARPAATSRDPRPLVQPGDATALARVAELGAIKDSASRPPGHGATVPAVSTPSSADVQALLAAGCLCRCRQGERRPTARPCPAEVARNQNPRVRGTVAGGVIVLPLCVTVMPVIRGDPRASGRCRRVRPRRRGAPPMTLDKRPLTSSAQVSPSAAVPPRVAVATVYGAPRS